MAEHIIGRHAVHKDDGNSFEPIPDEVVGELRKIDSPAVGIVTAWFQETFHGSVVARDVLVWNFVHDAVESLKLRLARHERDEA